MENYELEQKKSVVAEAFEIMGLKLLGECTREAKESEIEGYAGIAIVEAEKRDESFIVEKMKQI